MKAAKTAKLSALMRGTLEQLREHAQHQFPILQGTPFSVLLKRNLFTGQQAAVEQVCSVLKKYKKAILCGVMGTGKTLMAIAAAKNLGYKRTLVLCPPQLVEKWKREIQQTVNDKTFILNNISDVENTKNEEGFFIVSRETAKLSHGWRAAFMGKADAPRCPQCGTRVKQRKNLLNKEDLSKRKYKCSHCNEALWQADQQGPRRFALGEYIAKHLPKNHFDLFIIDEAHEAKAAGSAQGIIAGMLADSCMNTLALTGTLSGAYASTLFYLLWRFTHLRNKFKYHEEARFIEQYGVVEKITEVECDTQTGAYSKKRDSTIRAVERPGISPTILTDLLPFTVFVKSEELGVELPPLHEVVREIDMLEEQKIALRSLESQINLALSGLRQYDKRREAARATQVWLHYPDTPWREETLYIAGSHVFNPAIDSKIILPKELDLIEYCKNQKKLGRKVLVCVQGTNKRDVTERLLELLVKYKLQGYVLKAQTVSARQRESHIQGVAGKIDVLITHPRNVQTGLDLLQFPSIYMYQIEYSTYVLRQVTKRSHRIGQTAPVEIVHAAYRHSAQSMALKLIAKKSEQSHAVEGELAETGLSNISGGGDFLLEMARLLLDGVQPEPLPHEVTSAIIMHKHYQTQSSLFGV